MVSVRQIGQQGGINCGGVGVDRAVGAEKKTAVMSTLDRTVQSEVVHNVIP